MKSRYKLDYVIEDGVYVGHIKDLKITVQSESKEKMIQDAKDSAKVLFAHLAKKIEFQPIECEMVEFLSSPDSIGGKLNIPENNNESASYTVPENGAPSEAPKEETKMPDPELWSFVCDQIDTFYKLKGIDKRVDRHVGLFIHLDKIIGYK